MKAFAYVNAANQKDALAALATTTSRGKVLPIAGGMDLLGLMKDYIAQPDVLVNVKHLPSTVWSLPTGGFANEMQPKPKRFWVSAQSASFGTSAVVWVAQNH